MSITQIPLRFSSGRTFVCLRELCGHDEQSVDGIGASDAILLLDRLLVASAGMDITPGKASEISIADRDSLLAAIYIRYYGSYIRSTITCVDCEQPFDIDFSLEKLVKHIHSNANGNKIKKGTDGHFQLPDGQRFRLPTGEDEFAVSGMPPEEAAITLTKRCVFDSNPAEDNEPLQKAMKEVAPVLDLDMDAGCPECGRQQTVHFDIQYYLLHTMIEGKKQIALEVHRLATAYGWRLNEILDLPRSLRKTYVSLVESELIGI